jgi:allophanate hydrolase subunit 2
MGGVISADIGTLSQKLPGDLVTLAPISMERARREVEKLAEVETLVEEWCLS